MRQVSPASSSFNGRVPFDPANRWRWCLRDDNLPRMRLFIALLFTASTLVAQTESVLLRPQRVFDATGAEAHDGWVVLVTGDKIAAVGPAANVNAPAGAKIIDLPNMTLLPGLIDAHAHIFLHPYNETLWNDQVLKEPFAYRTIEATLHCRDTLLAGFTALRDLRTEGAGFGDVSVTRSSTATAARTRSSS